ncbi:hypothetical protein PMAYCL1PPCAC_00218, partial [Pristionchus mayeri]
LLSFSSALSTMSTPVPHTSEEDAVPLFIYTLEMFLLWFSVLLSACILTFLLRLRKFPPLFRVIYCLWNLRCLAVAIARTASLVLVIFKEHSAVSEFILSQSHEAVDCVTAFAVVALAVERLVANRSESVWSAKNPISMHRSTCTFQIIPALCAAYAHKN